jgi:hypothetical protein
MLAAASSSGLGGGPAKRSLFWSLIATRICSMVQPFERHVSSGPAAGKPRSARPVIPPHG